MTSFHLSSTLLKNLKSLFPTSTCTLKSGDSSPVLRNPWFIVAAVAFSASNRSEAVPFVFEQALRDLKSGGSDKSEELLLARKMREALFRSGLISGYPKVINSLKALHEVMPIELQDKEVHRDTQSSLADYDKSGQKLWQFLHGEKADHVRGLLDEIYPDMGWFSNTIGYGLIYAPTGILSPLENSYTLVAALIAGDTPQQIIWHLDGARRAGATLEEVQAVREISIEAAKLSGISWRHSIPQVDAEEV